MLKGLTKRLGNYTSGMRAEQFPINRMIGKNLGKSSGLPHAELLIKYDAVGRNGFDWKETRYYKIQVSLDRDLTENFSVLPEGLSFLPEWWVMPWASIPGKKRGGKNKGDMEARAHEKINEFFDVYESIKTNGYISSKGGAIKGYFLVHPKYGRIFNYIDGHHRMAILCHLSEHHCFSNLKAGVVPLGEVNRSELESDSSFVVGVKSNKFSAGDACKLFDHCFFQLELDKL